MSLLHEKSLRLQNDLGPVFRLGSIHISDGAKSQLHPRDILNAIIRHGHGDWEWVPDDDFGPRSVLDYVGRRIMGAFRGSGGNMFWVMTAADRSYTRVYLPREHIVGLGITY